MKEKNGKKMIVGLFFVLLTASAFALAPIQVTVENTTRDPVAINYKYQGEWVFPYTEDLWEMFSKGARETEWLIIPSGSKAIVVVDRGAFFRILVRNEYDKLWYTHVSMGWPQAFWDKQLIQIR
ncbi:MAG TPA: hypothetical protein P5560_05190 [Thermotogota bacterium]|nr:hypothetical protein [Thermotogota bacterium]HRW92332.1 hypothetical protein [Thermotogota bacterium]